MRRYIIGYIFSKQHVEYHSITAITKYLRTMEAEACDSVTNVCNDYRLLLSARSIIAVLQHTQDDRSPSAAD